MSLSPPGHTPRDSWRADFQLKTSVSGPQLPEQSCWQIARVSGNLVQICRYGSWKYHPQDEGSGEVTGKETEIWELKYVYTRLAWFTRQPWPPFLLFTQQLGGGHLEAGGRQGCYWPPPSRQLFPFVSRCCSSCAHCLETTRESVTASSVSETLGSQSHSPSEQCTSEGDTGTQQRKGAFGIH